jgi:hypothetical protein
MAGVPLRSPRETQLAYWSCAERDSTDVVAVLLQFFVLLSAQ